MKRILYMIAAVSLFTLLFAGSASAQRRPGTEVTYRGGHLYDGNGDRIDDRAAIDLFGRNLWNETFVGATHQYRTGKILLIAGTSAFVLGTGALIAGAIIDENEDSGHWDYYYDPYGYRYREYVDDGLGTGEALASVGLVTMLGGATAVSVGIPFMSIGKGRLKWLANDHNYQERRPLRSFFSLNSGRNGVGVALNF